MRTLWHYIILPFFVLIVMFVIPCLHQGKRPFLMIQICVVNDQGFTKVPLMLKTVAISQNMRFMDGSEQTQADLGGMQPAIPQTEPGGHVVNIGVERGDGVGVGAANLGLSKHQVALGFSTGSDIKQAQDFADIVIKELQRKWPVEVIPSDRGALPMANCN